MLTYKINFDVVSGPVGVASSILSDLEGEFQYSKDKEYKLGAAQSDIRSIRLIQVPSSTSSGSYLVRFQVIEVISGTGATAVTIEYARKDFFVVVIG